MNWKENHALEEERKKQEKKRRKLLAEEVTKDFLERREERKSLESGWLLNMNFLSGNQYCDTSPYGGVVEDESGFYWQSRRVFNHIAPAVDARMSKLTAMQPVLRVKAFSDEEGDVKAAMLATGVLNYAQDRIGLEQTATRVTLWAEVCGSAFYKVLWDERGGRQVAVDEKGLPVYEGEVCVSALSPFEIYPDRLGAESMDEIHSIIHAQVVSVEYLKEKYGVTIEGGTVEELSANVYSEPSAGKNKPSFGFSSVKRKDSEILIERYTRPNAESPEGSLEIVAGGELLYAGPLPYINGERGERGMPFVKQDCMRLPGAFFGLSIVDRLIPLQRAYNAVRNRKHEFLNRLAVGVLAVEDGSLDCDALAEEGLAPGKVLVYRQGSTPPELMETGSLPAEFAKEEEWLEKEFTLVSGVSDLFQNSTPVGVTSATGLQLLLSQDDTRMTVTAEYMSRALQEVGKQTLRLYKQFAGNARLMTMTGENKKTQIRYFNASELATSDIRFETEVPPSSPEKRETLLKLFEAGLLTDENGQVSKENKNRILEAFGYGSVENAKDISALHAAKAEEENEGLWTANAEVDEYDDHEIHLLTHTRYLLSDEFKRKKDLATKERFLAHLREHKKGKATSEIK